MISDPSIREQGYIYFLTEAPELLQIIEQELFSLSTDHSIAKVHNLMRATHTIKGGAANVGLEVINTVAHSLEDIFKALYNPDVKIDSQLQTLLFQSFECLQLPLTAELTGTSINNEEVLQRAASVFAQIQEKLGDAFNVETHIPTSEELGFDIVLSIFETGVTQRLESIAEAITNIQDTVEIIDFLRSQAEVFIGLAESLNLPGFGKIAQTIIAALEANPAQGFQIAEIALADLQHAREAVIKGDRTSGGEPSKALQQLTTVVTDMPSATATPRSEIQEFYTFLTTPSNTENKTLKPGVANFYLKVIRYIFGWFNHQVEKSDQEFCLALLIPLLVENPVNYLENWLHQFLEFVQNEEDSQSLCLYRQGVILTILLAIAKFQYSTENFDSDTQLIQTLQNQIAQLAKEYKNFPAVTAEEKKWIDNPKLQKLLVIKEISTPASLSASTIMIEEIWGAEASFNPQEETLSVQTEEVKNDNSSDADLVPVQQPVVEDIKEAVVEVITDSTTIINKQTEDNSQRSQNKNPRQHSFIRVDVEALQHLNYLAGELLIHQRRRTLQDEQLQEIIQHLSAQLSRHQATLNKLRVLPLQMQNFASQNRQNFVSVDFDSLEMDEYTEFHLVLHEATEETLQLQETTESLDLLLKQSTVTHEKKQRLAGGIIDNLVEARMLPLGNVLNRFALMIQNLGNVYGKLVELKLTGTQVLVDKAIAEKLYDPLLHLVRNAFDHGIEPPEIRRERGKSEQGLIEICAYHQGSQTIIEVRDNGQGLNFQKIRSKGIELGLIRPDNVASEEQLLELLFSPGFSTAGKVSEISGRGMGLDIVRSQLQSLNGSIAVQSLPNQGTIFVLKIPFSMTTDQLMIVQAGGAVCALLLDNIEKILLPSNEQIKEFEGNKVLHLNTGKDERMVSLRHLSELMHYGGSLVSGANFHNLLTANDTGVMTNPVLLLRKNDEIFGLQVDQIIGEQELVIRPLGQAIAPPKYVYGCSTLANGSLILAIDGALLLESCQMQATINVMSLPAARSAQKKALPMSVSSVQSTMLLAPSTTKTNHKIAKVILVVDDAISLRQTLSLTLQKHGYQVIQAENGVEALEQLQRHPEVQVVISDLEMPRMNGFEFLSNVRQNPDLANKPVVILTSRSAEKHRKLAQGLGANAYFTKPYLEHEFICSVEDLINKGVRSLNELVMTN